MHAAGVCVSVAVAFLSCVTQYQSHSECVPPYRTVEEARSSGIRVGDRILEVNGQSVRGLGHEEVGRMIVGGPDEAVLLVHTQKPAPTPDG